MLASEHFWRTIQKSGRLSSLPVSSLQIHLDPNQIDWEVTENSFQKKKRKETGFREKLCNEELTMLFPAKKQEGKKGLKSSFLHTVFLFGKAIPEVALSSSVKNSHK